MKVAFYTLGCKVNQYDTQMMTEKFMDAGYSVCDFDSIADIYVINTCTVTQVSDKKSRNIVSRARRLNENAVIIVCGCFSQVASKEVAKIEGVDIVLGTSNRCDIVEYTEQFLKTGVKISDVKRKDDLSKESISSFSEKTRAIIKIEDGCRNFCSYCLIPFARGKIISKELTQVIKEAKAVAENGYKEIVLTGIHLSSYGTDLKDVDLADAINAVSEINGIERIRLGSLEPRVITEEFLDKLSENDKLCPSFHLSLQSGCDKTLKAMNRKYSTDEYEKSVTLLRERYPDCAITTDVIVGFPDESEEDFDKSLQFVKKIAFAKVHIFPYSKRKGTKAAQMQNQIIKAVKQEREKRLSAVECETRLSFTSKMVGTTQKVLVEQCIDGVCTGFTENYIKVHFKGDSTLINQITEVTVTESNGEYLTARI